MTETNHITHYAMVMDDMLKCRGVLTNGRETSLRAGRKLADELQEKVIVFAIVVIEKPGPATAKRTHGRAPLRSQEPPAPESLRSPEGEKQSPPDRGNVS